MNKKQKPKQTNKQNPQTHLKEFIKIVTCRDLEFGSPYSSVVRVDRKKREPQPTREHSSVVVLKTHKAAMTHTCVHLLPCPSIIWHLLPVSSLMALECSVLTFAWCGYPILPAQHPFFPAFIISPQCSCWKTNLLCGFGSVAYGNWTPGRFLTHYKKSVWSFLRRCILSYPFSIKNK